MWSFIALILKSCAALQCFHLQWNLDVSTPSNKEEEPRNTAGIHPRVYADITQSQWCEKDRKKGRSSINDKVRLSEGQRQERTIIHLFGDFYFSLCYFCRNSKASDFLKRNNTFLTKTGTYLLSKKSTRIILNCSTYSLVMHFINTELKKINFIRHLMHYLSTEMIFNRSHWSRQQFLWYT